MRSNRISYLSLLRTLGKTDGQSLEELIIVSPCVLQIIILTTGSNQDILYSGIDKLTGAPIQCNIIYSAIKINELSYNKNTEKSYMHINR